MITLRFKGYDGDRSRLKEGMLVHVPTNWTTEAICGKVTKNAIPEIEEALEKKGINIVHYDWVFKIIETNQLIGRFGCWTKGEVLQFWEKVQLWYLVNIAKFVGNAFRD